MDTANRYQDFWLVEENWQIAAIRPQGRARSQTLRRRDGQHIGMLRFERFHTPSSRPAESRTPLLMIDLNQRAGSCYPP
jgi:hypothetical protein